MVDGKKHQHFPRDHFEGFIHKQVESGRYGSASEIIRASLRLLEERERKIRKHAIAESDLIGVWLYGFEQ